MKKLLFLTALVATMFVACTKPAPEDPNNPNGGKPGQENPVVDEEDIPENKEIVYDTDNNIKPQLNNVDAFGARIISHEYSSKERHGVIKFDKKVTTIGQSAFQGCNTISNIVIPNSVTSIGISAFASCYNIISITLGNKIKTIEMSAFSGCFKSGKVENIVIPNSVISIGEGAFYSSKLISITLSENITKIESRTFENCFRLENITLPGNITQVDDRAFYQCTRLADITIPDNVVKLGAEVFQNCTKLSKVTIGTSVTSIGRDAFDACGSLTELYCKATVPPTLGNDKSLGDSTNANLTIYVPTNSVEAYKSAKYWSDFGDRIVGYEF